LDDYPSMPHNQDSSKSSLLLKEPKDEQFEMELKDEPIDFPLLDGNQPYGIDFIGDEIKEEEILKDELMGHTDEPTAHHYSSEIIGVEKIRRSSRNVSRPVKYTESSEESDEEVKKSAKKP
ncbi:hypothetical protein PMAYCL1PPCAC_13955, partial [Pristionchus mayeri]